MAELEIVDSSQEWLPDPDVPLGASPARDAKLIIQVSPHLSVLVDTACMIVIAVDGVPAVVDHKQVIHALNHAASYAAEVRPGHE